MSQGGFLSLRAALTAPERVRALVLMDTRPGVEDPAARPVYDQLMAAWMTPDGPPQEVIDTVAMIILGPGYDGTAQWQERWRAMPEGEVRENYATLMSREDDVAPRVAELTMPALVVHGADDLAIPLDAARGVRRPRCRTRSSSSSRARVTPRTSRTPMRSTPRSSRSSRVSDGFRAAG